MVALKVAMISTGIGAIVVAIAVAGTWIYNNWTGIAEMFRGIGEGIKSAFPSAIPVIDATSSALATLVSWFTDLTGEAGVDRRQPVIRECRALRDL